MLYSLAEERLGLGIYGSPIGILRNLCQLGVFRCLFRFSADTEAGTALSTACVKTRIDHANRCESEGMISRLYT